MDYIHFVIFVSVTLGFIVGIFGTLIITYRSIDAILNVDISDPEKDRYNFMILCPLEDLHKKRYLIVEVKNTKSSRKNQSL